MTNVHRLEVKPRETTHRYKRHDITVVYIPGTKEFKWGFMHSADITFVGRASTSDAALLAAKVEVDHLTETNT